MEILIVLLALVVLLLGPVALVLAILNRVEITRLKRELADLTGGRRVSTPGSMPVRRAAPLREAPELAPAPGPSSAAGPASSPAASPSLARATSSTAAKLPFGRGGMEEMLGGAWLTWLGVLTIFFGTSFFLAVDLTGSPLRGTGQVLIGIAVAAAFAAVGSRLAGGARRILGLGLLSGAVALLFLSAYGAAAFHALLPLATVFPVLLGAGVIGAMLALRQDSLVVALLTLVCALLAPLLLASKVNPGLMLFAYLFAVDAGAALTAARRRWPAVPLVAFAGTAVVLAWWWESHYDATQRGPVLAGVSALWLLFAALPFVSRARPDFWGTARAVVVVAGGLLYLAVVLAALAPELTALHGPAAALLALVYVVAGARRRGESPPLAMTYYTGLIVAALAVPVQFDAATVTLGWALVALVLLGAGARGESAGHRLLGYAVLAASAFHLLTFDTADSTGWRREEATFLRLDFAMGAAACILFLVAGIRLRRVRDRLSHVEQWIPSALVLLGVGTLLWRISAESVGYFSALERIAGEPGSRRLASLMTLSFLWAGYAAAAIGAGFATRFAPLRYLGMTVLAVLIAKVFLLDIGALERGYRIASFVGVGLLLLAVSVLYQRERRS